MKGYAILDFKSQIHAHINAIHIALEQKNPVEVTNQLCALGVTVAHHFPGVGLEKLSKKLEDCFLPTIALPDLTLIVCVFDAISFHLEAISEKAGIVSTSILNSLKIGVNSYSYIVDDKDDRFSKALGICKNGLNEKTKNQITELLEKKLVDIMHEVIHLFEINQQTKTILKIKRLFLQKEKSSNFTSELVDDLVRSCMRVTLDEKQQLKPDMASKIATWIDKNPMIKNTMLEQYKSIDEVMIFTHFSRLFLMQVQNSMTASEQKPHAALLKHELPILIMDIPSFRDRIDRVRKEKTALISYGQHYSMYGHDKLKIKTLLNSHFAHFKKNKPSFLGSFFDTHAMDVYYADCGNKILQFLGENYPEYADKVKNYILSTLENGTLQKSRFLYSIKLLCKMDRSDYARAIFGVHYDDKKKNICDLEIKLIFNYLCKDRNAIEAASPRKAVSPANMVKK